MVKVPQAPRTGKNGFRTVVSYVFHPAPGPALGLGRK